MLLTAGQVWAMQLYVITPSGQVTLEVEPSDSFENIKVKIEDKTGFDPTYQHLYYNHIECYNNQTLYEVGITSGGQTLTMTYDFIPARQADGSWKFTMPNVNKLMEVEYYNTYTLTLSHNAGHGTVELLRPGSSATVGNAENAFQYCYDCQRSPAYPTVANNGNNNLFGFTNPYVGLNGVGVTNDPSGPWKLEYVGKYSHSEYNFSVSSVRHTYGLNSDEDVPIFLLYQWSSATNQYEPVVYGVACAYSKLNNTHGDDHTLLFVGEGHWGCFLSNNQHSQNLNISFDEDLSSGLPDFVAAATPALPDGVVDNHDGTYSVIHGTEVIIEAIANTAEYYYFDNWTNENGNEYAAGVVTPSGDRPTTSLLTFVVTGDTTVRGNFKIDTYTMRVKTNNTSMGHVGIGETVYTSEYKDTVMTYHQHIDVTAIPEPGYYFVNWTNENGVEVSTSITLNWMATADTILTANFAAYATLQVASNNTAWGTVGEPQVSAGNTDHVMTLYDESESTSNHMVPAYTCWFDASTKSQYVIPASKMADVAGGTISSIQYYTQNPVSWISGVVDVYLKEVTDPTLNNMEDKSSCTVVYTGQLTFENGGVTITFTNPYPYNGGNLLVGLENEAAGYNCGIQFLGEDAPGASMSGFVGNYQQQDFLPQCTFTYQPSGVKVNPNGGYYIIPGSDVTVTATPETGYFLENWTNENSSVMGTDEQITLTVTSDTNLVANFGYLTPGLTPLGELTIFGHSFVSTTGEIKRVPCITGTGEFTKVGSREPTTIDLSTITEALTAQSGDTLTGTLDVEHYPVKISIAKGATVLLDGVTINGTHSMDYLWAGITCKGDATIILKDGTTNKVTGFNNEYPGIYVPMGSTLTIKGGTEGTGKLIAGSNGFAAGIGAGLNHKSCGNIIIQGGTIEATGDLYASGIGGAYVSTCGDIEITGGNITAQGGVGAAGIGGGRGANCGAINISGGTIIATGGEDAAGIGGGGPIDNYTHCDSITITSTVTSVTATKGGDAPNSIGAGKDGTCGTVTIGNSTGAISTSPYTYQP